MTFLVLLQLGVASFPRYHLHQERDCWAASKVLKRIRKTKEPMRLTDRIKPAVEIKSRPTSASLWIAFQFGWGLEFAMFTGYIREGCFSNANVVPASSGMRYYQKSTSSTLQLSLILY
jgi:hypothetical protein